MLQKQIALATEQLKLQSKNYELEVISDKYDEALNDVIYGNVSLSSICNKDNIEDLKTLYASKKDAIKEEFASKNVKNKRKVNLTFILINAIINTTILIPANIHLIVIIIFSILFQFGLDKGYDLLGKIKTNHMLKKKIEKVLEEKEKTFALENSQPNLLEESTPEKSKVEDEFINSIREKMEYVNKIQYEGYKEHLMLLYKLLSIYITAKKELTTNSNASGSVLFCRPDIIGQERVLDELIEKSVRLHKTKQETQILDEIAKSYGIDQATAQNQSLSEEEPYKIELKFGK